MWLAFCTSVRMPRLHCRRNGPGTTVWQRFYQPVAEVGLAVVVLPGVQHLLGVSRPNQPRPCSWSRSTIWNVVESVHCPPG